MGDNGDRGAIYDAHMRAIYFMQFDFVCIHQTWTLKSYGGQRYLHRKMADLVKPLGDWEAAQ